MEFYITIQGRPDSALEPLTCSATRAASVNASLTPRFFIAEHSVWIMLAVETLAVVVANDAGAALARGTYACHLHATYVFDRTLSVCNQQRARG